MDVTTDPVPRYPVLVRGSSSHGGHDADGVVAQLTDDGARIEGVGDVQLGRYVWLDMDLPGGDVRALGEIERRDGLELALEVRFKHLFPDHRRRLRAALHRP